jgi:hypothetical protein
MNLRFHFFETAGQARIEIIRTDDDAEFTVQGLAYGLGDFHGNDPVN